MTTLDQIRSVARTHLELSDPALLESGNERMRALRLIEDLALDSIQLLTLTVEIENHFEVALDAVDPLSAEAGLGDENGVVIDTVGDLERLIERTLETQQATQQEPGR